MGEIAIKKKAITTVLSCFVVLVILMSSFSVAVIASDSSNSTASNVTDNANSSVESVALSNNITCLTCRDDLIYINKTETVVNESGNSDLPVLNDTDISTAKTVSSLGYCSYVWIEITDKYCKGYEVYVDGVYQFTEGESGTPDGYCRFKVTPGYHTFKLTLNGKEVSKGWNCQCGTGYNWMSMNDMIPHWCEGGGGGDCDNPPTVSFDKTKYYEGDTVHITVHNPISGQVVDYDIIDCEGNSKESKALPYGTSSIYYTLPTVSSCCYWKICFYWNEGNPPILGGGGSSGSYCTKCYSFYVCPHETPCKVWIEVVDKYCKGYEVYADGVYQFTEGESGTPDGYCRFWVTPGTHKFELRKNGCSVSKSWYCQCGTYYSWTSMNDMYPRWCECNKPTPPPVKEVKFRGEVLVVETWLSFHSINIKIDEILEDPTGNLQKGETVNVYGHRAGPARVDDVIVGDEVEVFGDYQGYVEGATFERIFLSDWGESSSDHYVKIIEPTVWNVKFEGIVSKIFNKESSNWYDAEIKVTKVIDDPSDTLYVNKIATVYRANENAYEEEVSIGDSVKVCAEYNSKYYETYGYALRDWDQYIKKIEKPDLIIQDIWWSPSNPKQGGTVTINVKTKNQGSGNTGGFDVCYYVDGSYYDRYSVSSLSAGSTTTTNFTWTAKCGSHAIKAVADCYNAVAESKEENNWMSKGGLNIPCKPDLIIPDITWDKDSPKRGDTVTFTVKIKNRGDGNAGTSTVKYYIDGSDVDSDTVPSLSVGSNSTQTFTWTANKCGDVQVKAVADATNAVDEGSNEGNNERTGTVSVICLFYIRPACQDINGNHLDGVSYEFVGYPAYKGTCDHNEYLIAPGHGTYKVKFTKGDLEATVTLESHLKTFAGTVVTLREKEKKSDLTIQDISWTPQNPKQGDNVKFAVTVKNIGKGIAGESHVFVYDMNWDAGKVLLNEVKECPSLKPGEAYTYQKNVKIDDCGEHDLMAWADARNEVNESNEKNNYNDASFEIPCPDLTIQSITWKPENPKLEDSIEFTITVKNQGKGNAGEFYVDVQINTPKSGDQFERILKREISSLAAGKEYTFTATYKPLDCGEYVLSVVADPDSRVEEPPKLKLNNWDIKRFTVPCPKEEGTLVVNVYSIDGKPAAEVKGTTTIELIKSGDVSPTAEQNIDDESRVTFTDIPAGDYYINVYHDPQLEQGSKAFWGQRKDIAITTGTTTTIDFHRYNPYVDKFYAEKNSVEANTSVKINVGIKVPSNCPDAEAYVKALVIIKDESGHEVYRDESDDRKVQKGGNTTFSFSYTPKEGTYSGLAKAYIVGGGELCTDNSGWVEVFGTIEGNYNPKVSVPACAPDRELGYVGTTFQFVVNVKNEGNVEDKIKLSATDSKSWAVSIIPSVVTLSAGKTQDVYVTVVGKEATNDDIIITAKSTGDETKDDQVALRVLAVDDEPLTLSLLKDDRSYKNTEIILPDWVKLIWEDSIGFDLFVDLKETNPTGKEVPIQLKDTNTGKIVYLALKLPGFTVHSTNFQVWRDGFKSSVYVEDTCWGTSVLAVLYYNSQNGKEPALPLPDNCDNTQDVELKMVKQKILRYDKDPPSDRAFLSPFFNQEKEYDRLLEGLDDGKPMILNMYPGILMHCHAVVAYKVIETSDKALIYVYDPAIPYYYGTTGHSTWLRSGVYNKTTKSFNYIGKDSTYSKFIPHEATIHE